MPLQPSRAARCLALLAGLALLPSAGAWAQNAAVDVGAAQLDRLLKPRPSPWLPDPRRMLELLAETPMRELFRLLSEDRDWGPSHPLWPGLLPEFRRSYLAFVAPDPAALRDLLAERLRATLSPAELGELVEALADPELERITREATRLGLDLDVAARTAALAAAPDLYSPAEAEAIRATLARLQGRDEEMDALAARLRALGSRFAGPAFMRYQAVMTDTLQPIASARVDDPEFQQRFNDWLSEWRERLRQLRS